MKNSPIVRRLIGSVVSTAMQKTIVVRVDRIVKHPKYGKRYRVSKKYKVDDPQAKAVMGEVVTIEACRPLSKDKRWRLVLDKKTS